MLTQIKIYFVLLLKGIGMGAANVIPGVSGGTIALITGIFERLIDSIKSFNLKAIKLIFTGKFKEFFIHTDLWFLISVLLGAVISIFTLAELLKYLFEFYPIYVWSFFFGLILASVYFVGKTIEKWNFSVIITFLMGAGIAIVITVLKPATPNESFIYLILCGVVAICSMILPGLSGSFILILMGNYQLIMIDAVSNRDIMILFPVAIGAAGGLLAFSHLLSWVYKKFRNETISILTGFILGSLGIIWPWKETITQTFGDKEEIVGFNWLMPQLDHTFFLAVVFVVIGIATIWVLEKSASKVEVEA